MSNDSSKTGLEQPHGQFDPIERKRSSRFKRRKNAEEQAIHPVQAENNASEKAVPWGPWAAVIYAVVIYFAAQILAGLAVSVYPYLRGWDSSRSQAWLTDSVIGSFWFVLIAEVLTVLAVVAFIRQRRGSLRAIGWRRPKVADPVYALAGFFVYFIVYAVLLSLATHLFPGINVNQKQQLGFNSVNGNGNLLLTFISLVILPPLAEETVFRGFVFTGIRTRLKPMYAAILTSVIFATAHLEFGSGQPLLWTAAIDTFTLSLVLCYLRQTVDSLWPGIFLHALKNGIAFVSLYLIHTH